MNDAFQDADRPADHENSEPLGNVLIIDENGSWTPPEKDSERADDAADEGRDIDAFQVDGGTFDDYLLG